MYLEKRWSHVREVEGLSAQAGQYLKRLYEARFFMTDEEGVAWVQEMRTIKSIWLKTCVV